MQLFPLSRLEGREGGTHLLIFDVGTFTIKSVQEMPMIDEEMAKMHIERKFKNGMMLKCDRKDPPRYDCTLFTRGGNEVLDMSFFDPNTAPIAELTNGRIVVPILAQEYVGAFHKPVLLWSASRWEL